MAQTIECQVRIDKLAEVAREIYLAHGDALPFHGWFHVTFVREKARMFATKRGANAFLVEAAALVHDLNYVVARNSEPEAGAKLRRQCLARAGFRAEEMDDIESLIDEAHLANRTDVMSLDGSALSDADMLFKALPTTPVVLAHRYLIENSVPLRKLAEKIVREQQPLLETDTYFHDPELRRKYTPWARANVELWRCILDALDDGDVQWVLREFGLDDAISGTASTAS